MVVFATLGYVDDFRSRKRGFNILPCHTGVEKMTVKTTKVGTANIAQRICFAMHVNPRWSRFVIYRHALAHASRSIPLALFHLRDRSESTQDAAGFSRNLKNGRQRILRPSGRITIDVEIRPPSCMIYLRPETRSLPTYMAISLYEQPGVRAKIPPTVIRSSGNRIVSACSLPTFV